MYSVSTSLGGSGLALAAWKPLGASMAALQRAMTQSKMEALNQFTIA